MTRPLRLLLSLLCVLGSTRLALAAPPEDIPDESLLGTLVVTGEEKEKLLKVAILPSLSPVYEDVVVRGVVRRDFELIGLFDLISDTKAPPGTYGFDDPINLEAWQKVGAEVIVKVAAKTFAADKVKIYGICYFLKYGKEPVYFKTFVVNKDETRVTAHRITDALLGAITGKEGSFASHLTFATQWGRNYVALTVDADGNGLKAQTDPADTVVAPVFGPNGHLFYSRSRNYSPFRVVDHTTGEPLKLPFKTSIYGAAYNADFSKLAIAVAEGGRSAIWVGDPDGGNMKKVSKTELATHPVFSPSGKLAWIGGGGQQGSQRVYVEGKAVSPAGFTAAAPTFCKTDYGITLIFAVSVGGGRQDLVLTNENGGGIQRLTQGEGSNSYPACSPDGRMLAYFSERNNEHGLYIKSLKSWRAHKVSGRNGQSLRWAALPALPKAAPPPAPATPATPDGTAPAAPSTTPGPVAPEPATTPAPSVPPAGTPSRGH